MHAATQPFFISNSYGLFGHMTTQRVEIIVEGTRDGKNWQAYEFKFKPGDVKRAPPIVLPIGHMPRLDWQVNIESFFLFDLMRKMPEVSSFLLDVVCCTIRFQSSTMVQLTQNWLLLLLLLPITF